MALLWRTLNSRGDFCIYCDWQDEAIINWDPNLHLLACRRGLKITLFLIQDGENNSKILKFVLFGGGMGRLGFHFIHIKMIVFFIYNF